MAVQNMGRKKRVTFGLFFSPRHAPACVKSDELPNADRSLDSRKCTFAGSVGRSGPFQLSSTYPSICRSYY